ncbi:hypothetical protein ANOBCDAF_04055 [Pleomorphomonas sp. T1.2MG-36]|uniref:hypothetical protein n=1 Tax=Pleomorphomonas sp. T1.2MG-36 TaxID=3041167 RepID=UPI0024775EAC|nr:hypothetical protein [Pleomorphomonas sp. T1.2MG-36]CAI9417738.1 hypothetical protein ANOBCDAF_04055 [Pleomorphomonas sp. T1.2MG-36]
MVRSFRLFAVIAVSLAAVLVAHSPATSAESRSTAALFDKGDSWAIMRDARYRTCVGVFWFENKALTLTSSPYEGRMTHSISFSEVNKSPESKIYNVELRNEGSLNLRLMGKGFLNTGVLDYVMTEPFGIKQLNAITGSRTLDVETDGVGAGQYDLSFQRRAFGRYYDCLKSNEKKKSPPATPPTVRRMN